jgi:uncharacterized surface protein with fasciclin (FAS1) repeats
MRKLNKVILIYWLFTGFCSCKKNAVFKPVDYNRISAIVNDNYNLSIFGAALEQTTMKQQLQEQDGPFTVLVPSDDAFKAAGISTPTALKQRSLDWISKMTNYHIVNGQYDLNKFPFLINQELDARGGKLYVSRWIRGEETIITVNGARVLLQDIPASNGRIQIINRVLEPYEHDKLADAIAANTDITFFAEALRRSGLMEQLRGTASYTVFAPSNAAIQAETGYSSIQQLNAADPAELKALCEYHIAADRRFVNDYILATGSSNISSQRMINTYTVTVNLIPNPSEPGSFNGINLLGPGNQTPILISRRDILAGNGVVHVLDGVLKMTR